MSLNEFGRQDIGRLSRGPQGTPGDHIQPTTTISDVIIVGGSIVGTLHAANSDTSTSSSSFTDTGLGFTSTSETAVISFSSSETNAASGSKLSSPGGGLQSSLGSSLLSSSSLLPTVSLNSPVPTSTILNLSGTPTSFAAPTNHHGTTSRAAVIVPAILIPLLVTSFALCYFTRRWSSRKEKSSSPVVRDQSSDMQPSRISTRRYPSDPDHDESLGTEKTSSYDQDTSDYFSTSILTTTSYMTDATASNGSQQANARDAREATTISPVSPPSFSRLDQNRARPDGFTSIEGLHHRDDQSIDANGEHLNVVELRRQFIKMQSHVVSLQAQVAGLSERQADQGPPPLYAEAVLELDGSTASSRQENRERITST